MEDVWTALTGPEHTEAWIGPWEGDPAEGEVELTMSAEPGAPAERVTITACDRPRLLAVTIAEASADPWDLQVTLSEVGEDATALHFEQRLLVGAAAEMVVGAALGWHLYLDRLGAVVEGRPIPDGFESHVAAFGAAYVKAAGVGLG